MNLLQLSITFYGTNFSYLLGECIGWVEGCSAPCICQQTRSSKCYECCRNHRQAWSTFSSSTPLVFWCISVMSACLHPYCSFWYLDFDVGFFSSLQVYPEHVCHIWGRTLWGPGLALQQHSQQGRLQFPTPVSLLILVLYNYLTDFFILFYFNFWIRPRDILFWERWNLAWLCACITRFIGSVFCYRIEFPPIFVVTLYLVNWFYIIAKGDWYCRVSK